MLWYVRTALSAVARSQGRPLKEETRALLYILEPPDFAVVKTDGAIAWMI